MNTQDGDKRFPASAHGDQASHAPRKREETPNPPRPGSPSLPAITLPTGGGAIRGIGEKFSTNACTGTFSLQVPLAVTAGRSRFGPALQLTYESGSGNGPFGIGWHLSPPSVTRKTDKGLPHYDDNDPTDIFILSGAEDLVPVSVSTVDGYTVQRYQPRIEGAFVRIERWTAT